MNWNMWGNLWQSVHLEVYRPYVYVNSKEVGVYRSQQMVTTLEPTTSDPALDPTTTHDEVALHQIVALYTKLK